MTKPKTTKTPCKISIDAFGGVGIEAPTKREALELLREVTTVKRHSPLEDGAIV